nr:CHASE3 domain-containing protein [Chloroflexota bacterium]
MATTATSLPFEQSLRPRTQRALLGGLIFVVVLLLALIILPPLANGRAEALRTHLDTDVQAFADALTSTENSVQEMQAATRGYLLTQQPSFLEQYRAAQDGLPTRLGDLVQLGPQVDPDMTAQVTELVQVAERWQQEGSDRQLDLAQHGRAANAITEVASGKSQATFDSFRGRVNDLQEQTRALQAVLLAQINRARTLQIALTSGLGVLGLLAVSFVLFGFRSLVALTRALQLERERAAALAQAASVDRQRLQTVFDHSPEGLVVAEAPHGQIGLANPAAVALLGSIEPGSELRTQPWLQRIYRPGGEVYPIDDFPLLRSIEHGEACRAIELTVEQPDGQRVPLLVTSVPVHTEEGSLRGAVAVFQDLRLIREVERLKSDFVALVSHELRTPLTAIQGCVQTLLGGGEADPG